jgi:hypothetical protein
MRGVKKEVYNFEKFIPFSAATSPTPTNDPVKACVVEMGNPSFVAKKTVNDAAKAIDIGKAVKLMILSGINPLPEKFTISFSARKKATIDPESVVTVAHVNAV